MENVALIVAAGRGTRLGGDVPKQYQPICGAPMLVHTLRALLRSDHIDGVCVVINEQDQALYAAAMKLIEDGRLLPPAMGGETRAQSVKNGLDQISEVSPRNVLIHDAARPFLSAALVNSLIDTLKDHEGAFPAIAIADALWNTSDGLRPVDRDNLVRAQTPQAFRFETILKAHQTGSPDARDDVEIARNAGAEVVPVEGEEANFKVTTQEDLNRAEAAMTETPDIRIGNGFDVHAFEAGDAVILNGIRIPHNRGLKGHSDADVGMHAITDAIYGALAAGDIGQWFPPSDPQWKGAASDIFLKHAVSLAAERDFQITHIDCTLICEEPKIGPHAKKMREELSRISGLEMSRISVKATTSERLGFTGRGEGIAAQATATLFKR